MWRDFRIWYRQTLGKAFSRLKNTEWRLDLLAMALISTSNSASAMGAERPLRHPYWELFRIALDSKYHIRRLLSIFSRILLNGDRPAPKWEGWVFVRFKDWDDNC